MKVVSTYNYIVSNILNCREQKKYTSKYTKMLSLQQEK